MLSASVRSVLPAPVKVQRRRGAVRYLFATRGGDVEVVASVLQSRGTQRMSLLFARYDLSGNMASLSGRSWPVEGVEPLLAGDFREQVAAFVSG